MRPCVLRLKGTSIQQSPPYQTFVSELTMSASNLTWSKIIRLPAFLLIGIAAAGVFVHLGINLKLEKYSHLALSLIFWLSAISLVWDKRQQIKPSSNLISCGLGMIIMGITLIGAFVSRNLFLGFAPLGFAISLALLASGISNLLKYRQELIILFTLGIPKILLPLLPDLSPLTAKISAFWLMYCGFDVILQNNQIILPQGVVNVVPSCSGLNLIIYMLGLSVIFQVMFPLPRKNSFKVISYLVAATIGFFVNSIRVSILALLSGDASRQAFEYWHSQEGALIFVTTSVLIYGIFCWFLLRYYFDNYQQG